MLIQDVKIRQRVWQKSIGPTDAKAFDRSWEVIEIKPDGVIIGGPGSFETCSFVQAEDIEPFDGSTHLEGEDISIEAPRGEVLPRSPAWWAEHTVVRLVVTHLNAHGARVLFSMPGRGIDLVAETPEQAERQIAYARERWPEGVYEVREARFWREADGSPGDPVHTLIDDATHQGTACVSHPMEPDMAKKTSEQLEREIAELVKNPKLGEPT